MSGFDINTVTVSGNLTREPELRTLPNGGQSNGFTPRSDVPANTDDFQTVPSGAGRPPADDDIPF